MGKFIDLTGQRFGRLTVIERVSNYISPSGRIKARWLCACCCGKSVVTTTSQLTGGKTRSCGCLLAELRHKPRAYNDFRIVENLVYVQLTNVDKEMIVDKDIWLDKAARYHWYLDSGGYAYTKANGKHTLFHIFAFPDCPSGMVRDHIDGNTLNNTRRNIRYVTHTQNMQNRKKQRNNQSHHTGVAWHNASQKWRAQIGVGGKKLCLGYFSDLQDAIAAREAAEIKYFGEYRRK